MSAPVPYAQELDRLRGERVVLRGLMQDALCYLDSVDELTQVAGIDIEPGTSARTLYWLLGDMRKAIESIEHDRARSIAAPSQPTPEGKQYEYLVGGGAKAAKRRELIIHSWGRARASEGS